MLSRTADNLYWLSRYAERPTSSPPASSTAALRPLRPAGQLRRQRRQRVGIGPGLGRQHRAVPPLYDSVNEHTVRDFLAFSPNNPSSIRSCLQTARENARSVRTALTREMWEAINEAYLHLRSSFEGRDMTREEFAPLPRLGEGVSLAFDGSAYARCCCATTPTGSPVSASPSSARTTPPASSTWKYHVLLPETERVGGSLDYFQWTTILREVSALTAYHWVYRESIKPWLVPTC